MRLFVIAATTAVALSGCVQTSANVYEPYAVGQAAYTEMGVVTASRPVEVASRGGTGIGAVVGAVAGGIAGSQIGPSRSYNRRGYRRRGSSAASALGTLGGAVIGGLIGAVIETEASRQTATEYVVRLDDGSLVTIVQGSQPIATGQRVFLQTPGQGRARIIPAA